MAKMENKEVLWYNILDQVKYLKGVLVGPDVPEDEDIEVEG